MGAQRTSQHGKAELSGNAKGQGLSSRAWQKGVHTHRGRRLPPLHRSGSVALSHVPRDPGYLCASYEETSGPVSTQGDLALSAKIALGSRSERTTFPGPDPPDRKPPMWDPTQPQAQGWEGPSVPPRYS